MRHSVPLGDFSGEPRAGPTRQGLHRPAQPGARLRCRYRHETRAGHARSIRRRPITRTSWCGTRPIPTSCSTTHSKLAELKARIFLTLIARIRSWCRRPGPPTGAVASLSGWERAHMSEPRSDAQKPAGFDRIAHARGRGLPQGFKEACSKPTENAPAWHSPASSRQPNQTDIFMAIIFSLMPKAAQARIMADHACCREPKRVLSASADDRVTETGRLAGCLRRGGVMNLPPSDRPAVAVGGAGAVRATGQEGRADMQSSSQVRDRLLNYPTTRPVDFGISSRLTVFTSRKGGNPSVPPSRPMPDCLNPPKAIVKSVLEPDCVRNGSGPRADGPSHRHARRHW